MNEQSSESGALTGTITAGLIGNIAFIVSFFYFTFNINQRYYNYFTIFIFIAVLILFLALAILPVRQWSMGCGFFVFGLCLALTVYWINSWMSIPPMDASLSNFFFLATLTLGTNAYNHILINLHAIRTVGKTPSAQAGGLLHFQYEPNTRAEKLCLEINSLLYSGSLIGFYAYFTYVKPDAWGWFGIFIFGIFLAHALYSIREYSQITIYSCFCVGNAFIIFGMSRCFIAIEGCIYVDLILSHIGIALLGYATSRIPKESKEKLLLLLNWMVLGVILAALVSVSILNDELDLVVVYGLKLGEISVIIVHFSKNVKWW